MLGLSTALAMMAPASSAPAVTRAHIDAAAEAAMAKTGAKGLAIAVVDHGRILAVRAYGLRNAAGAPLESDTVMYGASLTKMVVGYTVMQLVAEGKVDLDKPITEYLPKPLPEYGNLDAYGNWGDLAGDPRWRRITMRHVLTHSTGFANFSFVEPDRKLRIHFEPGSRYAYSGEGMMLLQFVLEKGLGLDLGQEVQRRVLAPFGMTNTSLIWHAHFARNLADGWKSDGSIEPHDERSRVRAAGSMDTTIADMARFAAAMSARRGLSAKAFAEWVRPQLPIISRAQFPTLAPEVPPADRVAGLSAGLGVVAFTGPQGPGFYKGGHNDSTGNTFVCVRRTQRCVVILSNDVRAEAAFPDLVEAALGETGAPWRWEYPELVAK